MASTSVFWTSFQTILLASLLVFSPIVSDKRRMFQRKCCFHSENYFLIREWRGKVFFPGIFSILFKRFPLYLDRQQFAEVSSPSWKSSLGLSLCFVQKVRGIGEWFFASQSMNALSSLT